MRRKFKIGDLVTIGDSPEWYEIESYIIVENDLPSYVLKHYGKEFEYLLRILKQNKNAKK